MTTWSRPWVMSTTNPHALGGLMSVVGEGEDQIRALTVICTYDSLDKIEQTQRTGYAVPPFDLAVMDEAHRIAGRATRSGRSSTTRSGSARTAVST